MTTVYAPAQKEEHPICGYDWRGLMKRQEVVEESFVTRPHGDGREITEGEEPSEEGRRRQMR